MLDVMWFSMIVVSVICSVLTGRIEQLSGSVLDGADKAVQLVISMTGVMCLWSGMMKIAERGGITTVGAKILSPLLSVLLPDYKNNPEVLGAVSANITANVLGLGNAATPLGIHAMKKMQATNPLRSEPNLSMVMFVVMNTASVQLLPTTIAAMRQASGSSAPYSILPNVWIASVLSLTMGIVLVKIFARRS